jgi:hypothetical protein
MRTSCTKRYVRNVIAWMLISGGVSGSGRIGTDFREQDAWPAGFADNLPEAA